MKQHPTCALLHKLYFDDRSRERKTEVTQHKDVTESQLRSGVQVMLKEYRLKINNNNKIFLFLEMKN